MNHNNPPSHIAVAESDDSFYIGFWKDKHEDYPKGQKLARRNPKVLGRLGLRSVNIDAVALLDGEVVALRLSKDNIMRNADDQTVETVFRDTTLQAVSECFTGKSAGSPLIERVEGKRVDSAFVDFESLAKLLDISETKIG